MGLAALTFLAAVAWLPTPGGAFAPRWWVAYIGSAVLLWTTRITMTPGHWLGVALVLYSAASLAWGFSSYDEINFTLHLTLLGGLFCIAAETEDLRPVYAALALGVTVSSVFAIVQQIGYTPISTQGGGPVSGLFLNKDLMAEAAVVALIGAVGSRLWYLIPGLLPALLLPTARGALLGLAAAVLWFAMARAPRSYRLPLLLMAIAWGAAFLVLDSSGQYRLRSLDIRFEAWNWTLMNLTTLGWGGDTFGTVLWAFGFAHDEFLHFAFELGAGSGLLWLIFAYGMGARLDTERAVLVAILGMSLVGFPLHAPVTALVAVIVAGRLCGARGRLRRSEPAGRAFVGLCFPPWNDRDAAASL